MSLDFDIGNLAYIIIMLVIVIAGAFGKKKKPVQKIQSAVEPEETANPFMAEDILERKLKEFLSGYNQPAKESSSETVFKEDLPAEEELDVPVTIESPYISPEVYSGGTKLDDIISPYDNNNKVLDEIGKEEGVSNWNYAEEVHIIDEIKLSEGKELVSVDYNPEILELLESFDARQGFIYSEIFNRKQF
jgi:hypothetical protein